MGRLGASFPALFRPSDNPDANSNITSVQILTALAPHPLEVFMKLMFWMIMAALFATLPAHARDLAEAAATAQSLFNHIGIAAVSIGITVGGILFAIGAADLGRMLVVSGVIGACAVFGAPAVVSLLGHIFGSIT